MGIQAYAKEKGYVHLLWIIAVQILIISGLLLLTPNGNTITAYIAFASSVASLILAVVAIFYSIISNQAFYQHIGSLQGLAEGIQKESGAINTNLKTFSERAEGLVAAIADVPGSVDRLASTLDDRLNTISPVKVTSKDKGNYILDLASVPGDKAPNREQDRERQSNRPHLPQRRQGLEAHRSFALA